MKTKLLIIILIFPFNFIFSQIVVKTNMASDLLRIPNGAVEFGISKKNTIEMAFYYNPMSFNNHTEYRLLLIQPEIKSYTCDKFSGSYYGLHALTGVYNIHEIKPPFALWNDMKKMHYKGDFYGIGFSYGYHLILNINWNIEASIGIGYVYVNYKKYPCEKCGKLLEKSHKNYLGPTKAAINLVYNF